MVADVRQVLSPVGVQKRPDAGQGATGRAASGKAPVIGLLNNSKPNVDFFIHALKPEVLSAFSGYQTLELTKPRSAGPCPDIEALAKRCSFVINAVAD